MRKNIILCVYCLAALLISGCSREKLPEVIDKTTISVEKDGRISAYVVEDFDKEYYNISELTQMAVAEAGEYNTKRQTGDIIPVSIIKAQMVADRNDKAIIEYQYDSAETYTDYDYNESEIFYGTVEEALQKQLDLNVVLYHIKDNTILSKDQLMADKNRQLIITDERAVIYCPGKVSYLSEGAVYNADGSVDTAKAEGLVYILLK